MWRDAAVEAVEAAGLMARSTNFVAPVALSGYATQLYASTAACGRPLAARPYAATSAGHAITAARLGAVRELHGTQSDRSCVHVEVDLAGKGGGWRRCPDLLK